MQTQSLQKQISVPFFVLLLIVLSAQFTGCASDSYTAKGAGQGATAGAVSGAVGGIVSALVFGGDPAEAAARGAVWGGAAGATAGAMAGSQVDRQVNEQQQSQLQALRQRIGDETFKGLEALADCNHEASLQQAKKAQSSSNPNYALAALWLEVLTHADMRDEAKARSMYPELVEKDWNIKTEAEAESKMRSALNALMDIREEYKMPRVCS
ncbi:MAG: hypothetical protein R3312_08975 [Gammaproteobacteria bacterium]|nr:hypothetical protein [Gammaproteobacteria bacterium]